VIVIDASVLASALLDRPQAVEAIESELATREHEWLHAPELIELETLNALRRLVARDLVDERRAAGAVQDLARMRLLRFPHGPLRERVWELRHTLTAYDAAYLALAEGLTAPVLLTGDAALARAAEASLGAQAVRFVD
jgi:predicted nucleic acid-binding protein